MTNQANIELMTYALDDLNSAFKHLENAGPSFEIITAINLIQDAIGEVKSRITTEAEQ